MNDDVMVMVVVVLLAGTVVCQSMIHEAFDAHKSINSISPKLVLQSLYLNEYGSDLPQTCTDPPS